MLPDGETTRCARATTPVPCRRAANLQPSCATPVLSLRIDERSIAELKTTRSRLPSLATNQSARNAKCHERIPHSTDNNRSHVGDDMRLVKFGDGNSVNN